MIYKTLLWLAVSPVLTFPATAVPESRSTCAYYLENWGERFARAAAEEGIWVDLAQPLVCRRNFEEPGYAFRRGEIVFPSHDLNRPFGEAMPSAWIIREKRAWKIGRWTVWDRSFRFVRNRRFEAIEYAPLAEVVRSVERFYPLSKQALEAHLIHNHDSRMRALQQWEQAQIPASIRDERGGVEEIQVFPSSEGIYFESRQGVMKAVRAYAAGLFDQHRKGTKEQLREDLNGFLAGAILDMAQNLAPSMGTDPITQKVLHGIERLRPGETLTESNDWSGMGTVWQNNSITVERTGSQYVLDIRANGANAKISRFTGAPQGQSGFKLRTRFLPLIDSQWRTVDLRIFGFHLPESALEFLAKALTGEAQLPDRTELVVLEGIQFRIRPSLLGEGEYYFHWDFETYRTGTRIFLRAIPVPLYQSFQRAPFDGASLEISFTSLNGEAFHPSLNGALDRVRTSFRFIHGRAKLEP